MRCFILCFAVCWCASALLGREWKDSSGKITQEADLVDFDEHLAILKKADGSLVAVPREQLSESDRKYLESQDARREVADAASEDRTWTLIDGTKITGKVVRYGRKECSIERRNGQLLLHGKPWKELTDIQRLAILKVAEVAEGKPIKDLKGVEAIFVQNKSPQLKYTVEGVLIEQEDKDPLPIPFVLFSENDLKVLKPGWDAWSKGDSDDRKKEEQSTMIRSLANEYQKTRNAELRIQMMQTASQWFDLWKVSYQLPDGEATTVIVPARDSRSAQATVLNQYPNAQLGPVAKIQRRY